MSDDQRSDWQKAEGRFGLPQKFRLGDKVRVRQDGAAPAEWAADWADVTMPIVGVHVDLHKRGRVCYFIPGYPHHPVDEDWLEFAP